MATRADDGLVQRIAAERAALMDVALGAAPPDLTIRGGRLVNTLTREIYPADVLVKGQRIAAVRWPGSTGPPARWEIDARGAYVIPGLIDPHMHLESASVTVSEFARAVVPRGVTTVVIDPHELGNVLGLRGIELVLEEARQASLNVLLRVPARVPEFVEPFETPGHVIGIAETAELLRRPDAACLAGDIHPAWILGKDPEQLAKIASAIAAGKTVSGFSPGLQDGELNAYIAAGIEDSHVPRTVEELVDNIRHGLHVLLTPRPGRFGLDEFQRLAALIARDRIDTRKISLCTDDVHAHQLVHEGHLDVRVRLAMQGGIDPVTAIQMATLNSAALMRIDRDYGNLAPGRFADLAIVEDLHALRPSVVVVHGRVAFQDGRWLGGSTRFPYPDWAKHTINAKLPILAEDVAVRAAPQARSARCRVIVREYPKRFDERTLAVVDGVVMPAAAEDIASVAVIERHHASGHIGRGFIVGAGIRRGAIASSINHNCHHLFAVGVDHADMALALNRLAAIGGGYVAARHGRIVGELSLPIIGLMSEDPYEEVARGHDAFEAVLRSELGCDIAERPLYHFNFLCSPVVPEVGITDRGLLHPRTMALHDAVVA